MDHNQKFLIGKIEECTFKASELAQEGKTKQALAMTAEASNYRTMLENYLKASKRQS